MSEYWKSTPKYWCKHCSTYVKDTAFERKQHESTGKHQGNLKRFLRGIQNDHERGEREKEKAKAEVDRLNRVVGGHTSLAGPSTSKSSTVRKTTSAAPSAVDQKRQWAQLAEMGIPVSDDFRAEMAMPGQWQTTSKQIGDPNTTEDSLSVGVRKRKIEGQEDEEEVGETVKRSGWGTTTRRYPKDEDLDLDALLNGSMIKGEAPPEPWPKPIPETSTTPKTEPDVFPDMTEAKTRQPEAETADSTAIENVASAASETEIKTEEAGVDGKTAVPDLPDHAAVPVFKKRKIKSKAGNDTN